ncbi:MAG: asparagine synthase (glutamine-hydrolyzing) [Chitinophagaceae bacterium]|nr:MAG: asparagine synthase (glutamine-hydrolyzing) [Chitinophagaceae bacterium]
MCGIAGSINHLLNIPLLTECLYHRGPDEQTTFEQENLQLHHHRLAILDIAGGKQPMQYGHLTIIFNGEIYNHQEVRKKHQLDCRTNSDTETILHAYTKLGTACFTDFDGMFAIAIYDAQKNELLLVRDRAGKKPLYYYNKNDQFIFASELNALSKQIETEVEEKNIEQYLLYGAIHGSKTPYKDIWELPPAHFAVVNKDGAVTKVRQWWSILPFYQDPVDMKENEAIECVDEYLSIAVRRRLESSDLEVGSFLSGGIDSGLVTSIAAKHKTDLKTFTVSFTGVYDEAPLARTVAGKYNTQHQEIRISFDDLQQDIEKILSNYGEPFFDDSAIPSYYVSKEARKHLTVILNGDGADELFGGYRRYVPFAKYDFFNQTSAVAAVAGLLKRIIPYSNEKQSRLNYVYRLSDLASQKGTGMYLSATTDIFSGFDQYLQISEGNPLKDLDKLFSEINISGLTGLQKLMCMDFNALLPDILLVKMDIATMANSLEGRSPFMAKELLEIAPRLKDGLKIRGRTTKYILRRLAEKYLPAELINQPKRGFEIPLKGWMDKELRDITLDYLTSPQSYAAQFVDKKFLSNLIHKKIGVSDEKRAKMLYALFALDVWHAKCIRA